MRNARRHFRLNMTAPAFVQLSRRHQRLRVLSPELVDIAWRRAQASADKEVLILIQRLFVDNEVAGRVMLDLFSRIKLFSDAAALLVQGRSAHEEIEKYKTRKGKSSLAVRLEIDGIAIDLFRALNDKVSHFFRLIDMALEQRFEVYIATYQQASFVFDSALAELDRKSRVGNLLASVFIMLNNRLHAYVAFLKRYYALLQQISNPEAWLAQRLNMSIGGVSFVSPLAYPKFERLVFHVNCYLQQEHVFAIKGKIVSSREVEQGYIIYVQFTDLEAAEQQLLGHYLQKAELVQVMQWQAQRHKHDLFDLFELA